MQKYVIFLIIQFFQNMKVALKMIYPVYEVIYLVYQVGKNDILYQVYQEYVTIDFHRFIFKKLYIGDIITNVISENKSNKNNIVIKKKN